MHAVDANEAHQWEGQDTDQEAAIGEGVRDGQDAGADEALIG